MYIHVAFTIPFIIFTIFISRIVRRVKYMKVGIAAIQKLKNTGVVSCHVFFLIIKGFVGDNLLAIKT